MRALLMSVACIFSSGCLAADFGCVLLANGQSTTLKADGEKLELPIRLQDCNGVRIVSGSVSACFLDDKGSRQCKKLQAGDQFKPEQLGAAMGDSGSKFRATLLALLKGDAQLRDGQTRAGQRYPGLPFGNIAALGNQLSIRPAMALGQFDSGKFSIRTNGASESDKSWDITTNTTNLFLGNLELGREYIWTISAKDKSLSGRFRIASVAEQERMGNALAQVARDNQSDAQVRGILSAEAYAEHGFLFEAELAVSQVVN